MTVKDQCCTLEQAKKLNELGVNQASIFFHVQHFNKVWDVVSISDISPGHGGVYVTRPHHSYLIQESYSAFTVAELGVMLLAFSGKWSSCVARNIHSPKGYTEKNGSGFNIMFSEAEGRADLLISLLEEGAITAEEVNQRLTANS